MMISNVKWADESQTAITATVNGDLLTFPAVPGNRHYGKILAAAITPGAYQAPALTVEDVQAECARRLAVGFDYDFDDARGIHTIATTDDDMEGWREVTDIANARIATSDTTVITIATETDVCQVTPLEWMAVLKAAAAFRQPIWGYSFALQAQDPIPADYADDKHWTESE